MKTLKASAAAIVVMLALSVFPGCQTYRYGTSGAEYGYANPPWAPPYYDGVRYYYIPDIECYYDIYAHEFIYLDHAQWYYSPDLPYMYRGFDLNNCFIVIVNSNIYQPWMHHQYYLAHFPRYYYRDYYDHSNIPYVRGYNENSRSAVYWGENDRNRARSWNDENLRNNRQFKYSKEDRSQRNKYYNQTDNRQSPDRSYDRVNPPDNTVRQPNPAGNPVNNPADRLPRDEKNNVTRPAGNENPPVQQPSAETRRIRETNYYGKPIGQPVKVERKMRNQGENRSGDNDNERINSDRERRSGRR